MPETKEQIEKAVDEVLNNLMGEELTQTDCVEVVERVAMALKDIDQKWLDFDDAPRKHSNYIYSKMYQKVYKRLARPAATKKVKVIAKKEQPLIDSVATGKNQKNTTKMPVNKTEKKVIAM